MSGNSGLKLIGDGLKSKSSSILEEVEEDDFSYSFEDPEQVLTNILLRASDYENRTTNERVKQIIKESIEDMDELSKNEYNSLESSEDEFDLLLAEEMSKSDKEWTHDEIKQLANQLSNRNLVRFDKFRDSKKVTYRRVRKKKRVFFLVAVIIVLSLGATLSTQGSRNYVFEKLTNSKGNDSVIYISSDDENSTSYKDELGLAYQEIKDELGIKPIKLGYRPEGFLFDNYFVSKLSGNSMIVFTQNDSNLLLYQSIARNSKHAMVTMDGKMIEECEIVWLNKTIEIYEIKDENNNSLYSVGMEINNAYYEIQARMDFEEFVKIIKSLKYF